MKISRFLGLLTLASLFFCLSSSLGAQEAYKFSSWTEIAAAMEVSLNKGYDVYAGGGSPEEARDWVNDAYFGYYEKEGFERMVKSSISGKRASTVEFKFATIKTKIKNGAPTQELRAEFDTLIAWLQEDAAALDRKFMSSEPVPAATPAAEGAAAPEIAPAASAAAAAPTLAPRSGRDWTSFVEALFILLREGFEAILVIAAIAAYLKRSRQDSHIRTVYVSAGAAVGASVLAAIAFQAVLSVSLENQEIIEGATMLLATVVLFGVSNWMFSKAEAEAWKNYIEGKVKTAVSRGSSFALGAAAFLAVFREGAETILFYQSMFAFEGTDSFMVWLGFACGCVGLVIIFMVIRHGTMRLPLKPFFIGTSILMFVMSLAFLGGGVKELIEGDVLGATEAPLVPYVEILGIFPYYQTLVPQIILLLLGAFSVVWIVRKQKRAGRTAAA
ncbi:MAG: FTR1 family iron permease [Deltaproteobacteria bacterium]|jgi:high-affinity iron transporter|nr:FTR1 family iron permease [Deltaproteobacteria bacterium]